MILEGHTSGEGRDYNELTHALRETFGFSDHIVEDFLDYHLPRKLSDHIVPALTDDPFILSKVHRSLKGWRELLDLIELPLENRSEVFKNMIKGILTRKIRPRLIQLPDSDEVIASIEIRKFPSKNPVEKIYIPLVSIGFAALTPRSLEFKNGAKRTVFVRRHKLSQNGQYGDSKVGGSRSEIFAPKV